MPARPVRLESIAAGAMNQIGCRLDILAASLDQEPGSAVGGQLAQVRLGRHLAHARALVARAQQGRRVTGHLQRGLGNIAAFENLLRRGARLGRVPPTVSSDMQSLTSAVVAEIGGLL